MRKIIILLCVVFVSFVTVGVLPHERVAIAADETSALGQGGAQSQAYPQPAAPQRRVSSPFGSIGGAESQGGGKIPVSPPPANPQRQAPDPNPLTTPAYTPTGTATVPTTVETPQAVPATTPLPPEEQVAVPEEQPQPLPQQPAGPAKKQVEISPTSDEIVFNFDNADINEVVNTIAEILGINYVSDPRVAGVVNIHTQGKLSKKDLFSVLETLLKINNFTIIKKGDLYQIVPLANVKQEYIPPEMVTDKDSIPLSDTLVMQILPLHYISAEDMGNIIKPLLLQGGEIIAKDNLLILVDFSSNLKKILPLIDLFDVDIFERVHMQVYEAKNADVEELASDLDGIFSAFKLPADNTRAGGITFVPISRVSLLMAISSNDKLLEKAMEWAKKLDSEVSETELKIFVYFVQNGKAVDIANVLNEVFLGVAPIQTTQFQSQLRESGTTTTLGGGLMQTQAQRRQQGMQQRQTQQGQLQQQRQAQAGQLQAGQTQTQAGQARAQQRQAATQRRYGQYGAGAAGAQPGMMTRGVLGGEAQIVVDEVTNALIIQATERDYRTIEKTLKKLDIYPKQVLIEVLIAEIRLDDQLKMGVEWDYQNTVSGANYAVSATGVTNLAETITSGLKYVVDKTGRFKATLQAYAAKDKVNILSSPHIMASDNKESSIIVSEEIPIASGQVTTTSAQPVVTTTVEYRDTGIILNVIPHINDKGLVTLDVSQEVSEQAGTSQAGGTENPIFLKRSAQTSMVVQDGQTVIIGGLIRESYTGGKSGVPILSRIPVMGALFGYQSKKVNRSELMLLLTPHVVTNVEQADLITKEYQDKLSIITRKKVGEKDQIQTELKPPSSAVIETRPPEVTTPEITTPQTTTPNTQ